MNTDLIPVPFGPLWGYLDRSANLIIPPRFTWAGEFSGGLACVNEGGQLGFRDEMVGGKWGYIDSSGSYAFAAKFDEASAYSEGLAAVNLGARAEYAAHEDGYYSTGGKCGYIDAAGKWIVPPTYRLALDVCEGLACVGTGDKSGYLDAGGKWVIDPRFDSAYSFKEGFAVVRVGELYSHIGKDGQFLMPPQFGTAGNFSEGLAVGLLRQTYTFSFFDTKGTELFRAPENIIGTGGFSNGLCYAALGQVKRFHDGELYPIGGSHNYGYIDRAGNWSIPPQYDFASNFSEGLAWVRVDDNKHMYIRPDGSPLNGKLYDRAGKFRNGLALVSKDCSYSLIDSNGLVFWEC
jgi:hypothetical protein